MFVTDSIEVSGTRLTADGFLVVDAKIARTGLYTYLGSELDRPDLATVVVYRPEDSVFDERAMASFAHKPVTDDHPPEQVSSANWKKYSVGYSGDQVARDGAFVRVPMMVTDSSAITAIQSGKRELSAGYCCDLDFKDGVTPEGEPYQAVMKDIRGNHIAIVDKGRAGSECRIGDHYTPTQPKQNQMESPLKVILIDGLSVEFSEQGAQAVEKLQKQMNDAKAASDILNGQIDALKANHTKALEAKDGEIAGLKGQILDGTALDARLAQREAVKASAGKLLGDSFDMAGKSEAEIRRAAVAQRLGDTAVTGKSDDYVAAAFETLTAVADAAPATDPLRFAAPSPKVVGDAATAAWQASVDATMNAWRSPADQKGVN